MRAIKEADGVFQGGGVKGLALAGALLGFAEHELSIERWVNVAGTSAGAIIAAYLATGHGPADLERALRQIPYERIQAPGRGGRIAGGAWNLAAHHGLARGEVLRQWIDDLLEGATFASVRSEAVAEDKTADPYRLRLIAADVTQRQMLVLPADLARYRLPGTRQPIDVDAFTIADAVRMSMSIPFFFEPVLLESEAGELCTIVDGSILSNFPVWLFDVDNPLLVRPTFGFRLVGSHRGDTIGHLVDVFGWPVRLGHDLFHTALEAWDTRFTVRSTTVRTVAVPAGNIDATDFSLGELEQQRLIDGGREAAKRFLDDFRLEDYVNTFGRRMPR